MHRDHTKNSFVIISVFFIAIAALVFLQACASKKPKGRFGEERRPSPEQVAFNNWDKDMDGAATCDEFRSYRNTIFNLMDTDADRLLSEAELEEANIRNPFIMRASWEDFDADANGIVTGTEFSTTLPPFFIENDTNEDCILTASEAGVRIGREAQGQTPQNGKEGRGERRRVASVKGPQLP